MLSRKSPEENRKIYGAEGCEVQFPNGWGAFDSAKDHKRKRRKRQSVTAKRDKSQTPKFV